jgi:hypothetical protein
MLQRKLSSIHLTFFSDTRDSSGLLPLQRQPVCWNWWFQRQMLFLIGGAMLKRRRNARCTAVADSNLMNSLTQNILYCIVANLLSGCALGEFYSSDIWNFRTSSFECYLDHPHMMHSSGNIAVRNWVHLFESPCRFPTKLSTLQHHFLISVVLPVSLTGLLDSIPLSGT